MRGHYRYPIKYHYYTDREKLENRDRGQNDLPIPTFQEITAFLGETPKIEDLPDWLIESAENREKLEGFYSQIPHELLCDPMIPSSAKIVFCLFHKYSKPKDLSKNPTAFVGKKTIAKHMGKTPRYVSELIRILEQTGWLKSIPRMGKTNKTILHDKPFRAKT
jgi:hypothetical protein